MMPAAPSETFTPVKSSALELSVASSSTPVEPALILPRKALSTAYPPMMAVPAGTVTLVTPAPGSVPKRKASPAGTDAVPKPCAPLKPSAPAENVTAGIVAWFVPKVSAPLPVFVSEPSETSSAPLRITSPLSTRSRDTAPVVRFPRLLVPPKMRSAASLASPAMPDPLMVTFSVEPMPPRRRSDAPEATVVSLPAPPAPSAFAPEARRIPAFTFVSPV